MSKSLIFVNYGTAAECDMTVGRVYEVDNDGYFLDDQGDPRNYENFKWEEVQGDQPRKTATEVKADRFNAGKPQLSYMLDAPNAMVGLCRTFEAGAKKYSRDNWKKGLDRNELTDCLMRHLIKSQAGEIADEETGVDHLYHVLWNALVLAEQYGVKESKDE